MPPTQADFEPLPPYQPAPTMIVMNSFMDRVGNHQFSPPHPMWGYLPQVNEWAGIRLVWEVERVGGKDHVPLFQAVPVYNDERLETFAATGESKKAAKEKAATLMAQSGHC